MSSLVKIEPVFAENVAYIWHECKPHFLKALEHTLGELSVDDIKRTIESGERALFVVYQDGKIIAAITTRIDFYPSTGIKNVIIDYAGGENFQAWSDFTDYIEPLYKSQGCDNILIAGRLGWLRLHTDKGFKPIYHVIGKGLKDGKI